MLLRLRQCEAKSGVICIRYPAVNIKCNQSKYIGEHVAAWVTHEKKSENWKVKVCSS